MNRCNRRIRGERIRVNQLPIYFRPVLRVGRIQVLKLSKREGITFLLQSCDSKVEVDLESID